MFHPQETRHGSHRIFLHCQSSLVDYCRKYNISHCKLMYFLMAGHGMMDTAQWTKLQEVIPVIRRRKNENWYGLRVKEGKKGKLTMIGVNESFTNGKRTSRWLEVDTDEGPRHGTSAWEKKWSAFFNEARKLVTNCIHSQIWPIVSDPNSYSCRPIIRYYFLYCILSLMKRRKRNEKNGIKSNQSFWVSREEKSELQVQYFSIQVNL